MSGRHYKLPTPETYTLLTNDAIQESRWLQTINPLSFTVAALYPHAT